MQDAVRKIPFALGRRHLWPHRHRICGNRAGLWITAANCQHIPAVVGNSRARGLNPPHIGDFRVSRDERTASHSGSSQAVHPPLVGHMGAHAVARAESDDEECDQNCKDRNHRSHPLAPLNHLLTGIWPNYDRYWAFWVGRSTGRQPKQRAADADAEAKLPASISLGSRRST